MHMKAAHGKAQESIYRQRFVVPQCFHSCSPCKFGYKKSLYDVTTIFCWPHNLYIFIDMKEFLLFGELALPLLIVNIFLFFSPLNIFYANYLLLRRTIIVSRLFKRCEQSEPFKQNFVMLICYPFASKENCMKHECILTPWRTYTALSCCSSSFFFVTCTGCLTVYF